MPASSSEVASLREALRLAADALKTYATPEAYTDANGEQLSPDEDVHPGLLAALTLAQIDALAAPGQHGAASEGAWMTPPGMKPWAGGDDAPTDWDATRPILTAAGNYLIYQEGWTPFDWRHSEGGFRARGNIIAYTSTDVAGTLELQAEVELLKQQGAKLTIAYHAAICSPKGAVPDADFYDPAIAANVQRMLEAGIPLKAILRRGDDAWRGGE